MKVRQVKESGRYGSSNPDLMSPGSYDRFQQDQMDYGKREFKRREMEHELGHEDEQQRKEQSSTYYIRINGKLLKNKEGQPYQFRGKEAANKAAVTMMSKPFNRDKKFTLTTTASDKQDNPTPESSIAEMDGAPGQILAATGDKVTIDNKDGTQTVAPKASLTRDPTGKGFVLSKTPAPGGEKPDEPKPGETVFQPATTEGIKKMNETIRMLRLAGLHTAADRLTEQLVERAGDEPMSDADYAKQMAQGQKNLNAVKGFFGGKPAAPAELKDAPPGTPTDPFVRQRMGYKPATPAEIAASQQANPGGLVDGSGKPVTNSSGQQWGTGTVGGQAASPAAPAPAPAPQTGAAANPMEQDPAQRAQAAAATQTGAASNMAKDPAQAAAAGQAASPAAPATQKVDPNQADRDDAEQGAAMRANAAGGNSTSSATGAGNPGEEAAAELARIKQLAGTPAAQKVDPNQADRDDAEQGAAMRANAAGGNSTSAATGVGIPGEEAAATNAQAATQAATQAANGVNAAGQNVTMPDGTNPETGEKTTTAAAPAPTQAASPAAAKTPAKSDPKVLALQQDLIRKGAKIKPDGVMGPATAAAQKQFGAARDPNAAYRGDRSDMKPAAPAAPAKQQPQNKAPAVPPAAARPGVNQPAAKPAGGQAASPAAPAPAPAPAAGAPTPSLINRFRASRGLPTSEDRQYYEELDKMLTIAKLR